MSRSLVIKGSVAGLVSGIWLGLFFKMLETYWNIKLYTLLLNIDYVPVFNRFAFPEAVEFSFHLLISIILAVGLFYVAVKQQWTNKQMLIRIPIVCFLLGLLLYPTTALSERTPPLTSGVALLCWQIGHLFYGVIVSFFYMKKDRKIQR